MNFADRLGPSELFEAEVVKRLNRTGWGAFPFGQSLLSPECRKRLMRFQDGSRRPSLIRWMPDVITFRDVGTKSWVALIDAKVCLSQTGNYAIELSAVETCEIYTDRLFTPTFFVFDDWTVLTPREARQRGRAGPPSENGSGTAYVLVSKQYGVPFEEIFPPVPSNRLEPVAPIANPAMTDLSETHACSRCSEPIGLLMLGSQHFCGPCYCEEKRRAQK